MRKVFTKLIWGGRGPAQFPVFRADRTLSARVDTLPPGMVRPPAMKRLRLFLCLLVAAWAAAAAGAHAQSHPAAASATPPTTALTPGQAQQVLQVLQDDNKRAQFISTLQAIARALPPQPAGTSAPAGTQTAPASGPAPAAATAAALPNPLAPNGLGAQVLAATSQHLSVAAAQFVTTVQAVTDFPLLWYWLRGLQNDPAAQARLLDAAWKLLLVLVAAGALERLTIRGLRRARRALDAIRLDRSSRRIRRHRKITGPALSLVEAAEPPTEASQDEDAAPGDPSSEDTEVAEAAGAATEPPAPFTPPRRRRPSPWALLRRVPYVLLRLAIDLLPVLVFAAAAYGLLATPLGGDDTTRQVILAVVDAYLTCRVVMCGTRMMVSPNSPSLRLVHVSNHTAAYIMTWVRRIAAVSVFGYSLTEVGLLFGLYERVHDAVLKLVALVVHVMLVVIVLQIRRPVAARLRARPEASGLLPMLRNRIAETWHFVAIFYIAAVWLVWAFEVRNGYARLWHGFIETVIILNAARLVSIVVLGALDRGLHAHPELSTRFPGLEKRASRYHPLLRSALSALVAGVALIALLQAWGLDALVWFRSGEIGGRLLSALATVAVASAVAVAVWEISNAGVDRQLDRLAADGQLARAARLRTLLPILRTGLFITILIVVGLTALSEIGVNIAPLLAGAGIVGVAIGFGSQKLVQDFITGIFLLLENAMQVGDWVTVSGLSGSVEKLSIRTLRLRAGDGSVHLIPFSAVTSVTNTNRGIGNAAVSVTVDYEEDTDRVGEVLNAIAAEMRADPAYAELILSDLQLWGVDRVDGAMVTIVGQIVCTDGGRWGVQREFNRRMKKRFQELGIAIPPPMHRIAVQQGTAGREARPSPEPSSVTVAQSPPPAALGNKE
ncbi:MAG: mechanosensitive ion channel [Acidisphaera sp.]|nr:mechanosensitive ion channel [Acidisphaera sp.]